MNHYQDERTSIESLEKHILPSTVPLWKNNRDNMRHEYNTRHRIYVFGITKLKLKLYVTINDSGAVFAQQCNLTEATSRIEPSCNNNYHLVTNGESGRFYCMPETIRRKTRS
jgi:hypothetical protein